MRGCFDSHSLARARREPERFRASARAIDIADGYATVRLARYAYARLTVDESRWPGSVGVRPKRSCPRSTWVTRAHTAGRWLRARRRR